MSQARPTAKDRSRFRKPSRFGLVLFSLLLLGFASYLIYQLYQIQIVNYAVNAEKAAGQH